MAINTVMLAIGPETEPRVEALADAVIELAAPTGADVVLAHAFAEDEFHSLRSALSDSGDQVVDSVARRLESSSDGGREADLSPDQVANRVVAIRDVKARLAETDIDATVRGTVGDDVAGAIVSLAEEVGADRLVVGGRKRSPAGKAVFGSTAQAVLMNAPCPVEFVRVD